MQLYIMIFLAMAVYVSLNTIRVILTIRGNNGLSSIIAAAENFSYMVPFAYAIGGGDSDFTAILVASLGYAFGVLLGAIIEKKLNMGHLVVQIIAEDDIHSLVQNLRKDNFAITNWKVEGLRGDKDMLYVMVKKKRFTALESRIKELNPNSFMIVYEPKAFYGGYGN